MHLFNAAADLHGAPGAWQDRPTLRGDSYASLDQIVDNCIGNSLALLLAGDVFDMKRPPAETVVRFGNAIARMKRARLRVLFIQGQHEFDKRFPWLLSYDWPEWIDQQLVDFNGVKVYGLDWRPRGELQEQLAQVPPDADILLCHQVWEDYMGVANTDGRLGEVPHVKMIITGDFHKTDLRVIVADDQRQVQIVSPGSTCMQDKSEPTEKGFCVVNQAPDLQIFATMLPLRTRRVIDVSIMSESELVLFESNAGALQPSDTSHALPVHPLVRLRYLETVPEVYRRIMELGKPVDRLFLEPVAAPSHDVEVSYAAQPVGSFDGVVNAVTTLAQRDPQKTADLLRILNAPDQLRELEMMFDEYRASMQTQGAGSHAG